MLAIHRRFFLFNLSFRILICFYFPIASSDIFVFWCCKLYVVFRTSCDSNQNVLKSNLILQISFESVSNVISNYSMTILQAFSFRQPIIKHFKMLNDFQ